MHGRGGKSDETKKKKIRNDGNYLNLECLTYLNIGMCVA